MAAGSALLHPSPERYSFSLHRNILAHRHNPQCMHLFSQYVQPVPADCGKAFSDDGTLSDDCCYIFSCHTQDTLMTEKGATAVMCFVSGSKSCPTLPSAPCQVIRVPHECTHLVYVSCANSVLGCGNYRRPGDVSRTTCMCTAVI